MNDLLRLQPFHSALLLYIIPLFPNTCYSHPPQNVLVQEDVDLEYLPHWGLSTSSQVVEPGTVWPLLSDQNSTEEGADIKNIEDGDVEEIYNTNRRGKFFLNTNEIIRAIVTELTGVNKEEPNQGTGGQWEYTGRLGTEYWGTINHNCLGTSQSPINMDNSLVVQQDSSGGRVQFENYDKVTARTTLLENNGHTVELKVVSGDPTMSGGHLRSDYQMAQLHFHWGDTDQLGSEHTINRRRFPLEMHLVHLAASNIPRDEQGGLAVAGFVFQISREDNPNIEAIMEGIKDIRSPHSETHLKDDLFRVSYLISPGISGPYYSYSGSLTTPGCDEVVEWILFSTPLTISSRQIAAFRTVFDSDGEPIENNFRPEQRLNDRTVTYHTPY